MMDLSNKSILITGGTGSLGKALTENILKKWPNVKRLVIFSRDEKKQFYSRIWNEYMLVGPRSFSIEFLPLLNPVHTSS